MKKIEKIEIDKLQSTVLQCEKDMEEEAPLHNGYSWLLERAKALSIARKKLTDALQTEGFKKL